MFHSIAHDIGRSQGCDTTARPSRRVKAELGPDKGQQHVQGRPQGLHSDAPAFQVGDPANTLVPEQTIQPTWMPASSVIGSPASIDWTNCEA